MVKKKIFFFFFFVQQLVTEQANTQQVTFKKSKGILPDERLENLIQSYHLPHRDQMTAQQPATCYM